jgi:type IV secretory pathway VirJ component
MTMVATSLALATIILHGHPQRLHVYGPATGRPVILASGDGGWIHLAPHIAESLAARGWFVTGFDAKAYLSSGTSGGLPLGVAEVQRDFEMLVELAGESGRKPLLVGVSEGAGLSVLAASNPKIRDRISGVVTLGLEDPNELRWRWRDSIIYLTKGVPSEPIFHAADFIPQVSPAPLALVWSAHDEFVAASEQHRLAALARAPKRAWTVEASDHRFSDNVPAFDTKLMDAIEWISRFRDH